MSSICIIDTTVLCNILRVPNMDQDHQQAMEELEQYVEDDYTLLLPMAAIYETGNHIAHNGSGNQRRRVAKRFVDQVQKAFKGEAPWTPTPLPQTEEFIVWLSDFPDSAMRGTGVGDLTIVKTYDQQCQLHPGRRVFIWSYDGHLRGYDRPPTL